MRTTDASIVAPALVLRCSSLSWLRRPLGLAIELLAAILSIVYGMSDPFVFASLFAEYFQTPVGDVFSDIPIGDELFSGTTFKHDEYINKR